MGANTQVILNAGRRVSAAFDQTDAGEKGTEHLFSFAPSRDAS